MSTTTIGSSTVTLRIDEMKALAVELEKAKGARVKVGIMGDTTHRWGPGSGEWTNAGLGAAHEFGSVTRNLPARSFLRVPLMTRLPTKVDEIGRATWRSIILTKGIMPALQALGFVGENIVQRAFETGGFGAWAPLSPRYARWKEQTIRTKARLLFFKGPIRMTLLVLTGQLRRAITSQITFYGSAGRVAPGGARGVI